MNVEIQQYCGFITIIGRPNVGKSTLLNCLLQQKISITSSKGQTTRECIMGIHTEGSHQAIYIDTPGFQYTEKKAKNILENSIISHCMDSANLIIFVVEGIKWFLADEIMIKKLYKLTCPIVLTINKIDTITNKRKLLPHIRLLTQKIQFQDIVPICAEKGTNVDIVADIVRKVLPISTHHFPKNYITNCSQHFIASEIVREKLMRFLGDELPYSIMVNIKFFMIDDQNHCNIQGLILVERNSQKKIVIGKKGNKLKIIGIASRQDMEMAFKKRVNLKLWVKVKSN
ncbi:GTPase Era [Candidatus Curculioniphilus buchneri]|uniref:GTPase Era n=1 Tax=Candidatus Curculioniphilus buchneri TaxID=690594 RepID=UPI00376EB0E0